MHTSSDARLVLLALLACAGTAALARQANLAQREPMPAVGERPPPPTPEGDQLRDGRRLDLNRATAAELELLPGIGPRLAREIVAQRAQRGGFANLEALDEVRGIGPKKLARLRPLLRLEQLEHPTQPQRDVGRAEHTPGLEQDAAAQVHAHRPGARGEVVEPDHQVGTGP